MDKRRKLKRKPRRKPAIAKADEWKPQNLVLQPAWVGHGVLLYSCFAENSIRSVGSVWVDLTGNSFNQIICYVLDIYVPKCFRRMGVATFMMQWLLKQYGILQTGTGSKDGGKALIKKLGWKRNMVTGDWYLRGKPQIY